MRVAQHDEPSFSRFARHRFMLYRFVPPRKRGRHDSADRCKLSPKAGDFIRFGQEAGQSEDDYRFLEIIASRLWTKYSSEDI